MTVYRIPKVFYEDHIDRDLDGGTVVRSTKSHHYVDLDDAAYAELVSDADHYSDQTQFDAWMFGVCTSARATWKTLTAQGPPSVPDV